jgi:hypothetical protein
MSVVDSDHSSWVFAERPARLDMDYHWWVAVAPWQGVASVQGR